MIGKRINANALIDTTFPVRSGASSSDIIKSSLALLCLGKCDFDAIESFRNNAFFKRALPLGVVPSSPALRQRMDANAQAWFDLVPRLNELLLTSRIHGQAIDFGRLDCGYTPLDLDTFAMDNSGTKKELVGRTYTGVDGYCPLAAYLGNLGYCLELALRPGVQHSARETEYNLERVLPMAASMVSTPLLVRADSGFCSVRLMQAISAQADVLGREMAFVLKWNPRQSPVETLAAQRVADPDTAWVSLRAGKRECLWQERLDLAGVGSANNPVRLVYRLDRAQHRQAWPCSAAARVHIGGLDDHAATVVQP